MAKGQKRSNKETKKPKQKKVPPTVPSSVERIFGEPASPRLKKRH